MNGKQRAVFLIFIFLLFFPLRNQLKEGREQAERKWKLDQKKYENKKMILSEKEHLEVIVKKLNPQRKLPAARLWKTSAAAAKEAGINVEHLSPSRDGWELSGNAFFRNWFHWAWNEEKKGNGFFVPPFTMSRRGGGEVSFQMKWRNIISSRKSEKTASPMTTKEIRKLMERFKRLENTTIESPRSMPQFKNFPFGAKRPSPRPPVSSPNIPALAYVGMVMKNKARGEVLLRDVGKEQIFHLRVGESYGDMKFKKIFKDYLLFTFPGGSVKIPMR